MHRSTSRAAVLATLVVIALVLAACGSSASSPAATTAPTTAPAQSAAAPSAGGSGGSGGGGGNAVTVQNFAFNPATIEVSVGTTVTWTNMDSATHTVTADDGSFDSNNLATSATFSQTFATAGTFTYHCKIHSSMKATVTVK